MVAQVERPGASDSSHRDNPKYCTTEASVNVPVNCVRNINREMSGCTGSYTQ